MGHKSSSGSPVDIGIDALDLELQSVIDGVLEREWEVSPPPIERITRGPEPASGFIDIQ
jgi:hypothetical protein